MARNEKNPEKITIRPFTSAEAETVSKAYRNSDLKKPDFWTRAIVAGCERIAATAEAK